ncbi:MAG: AEC family transporter [Rhodospirillales bacterium]
MLSIFLITLPFFSLIICGYGAGRWGLLNEPGIKGVNGFVFYFALPALLFTIMAKTPVVEILDWSFIGAYLLASLSVFTAAAVGGRILFGGGLKEGAVLGLAASYSNIGFMGIPLLIAVIGNGVAVPLALVITVDLAVTVPLAMLLIELDRDGEHPWPGFGSSVIKVLFLNPLVVSIFAGILVSAAGAGLPAPVGRFLDLLAAAAGPSALFALGAALANRPLTSRLGETGYMCAFKLVIHPLAVWGVMAALAIDPMWAKAATLGVSMPIAAGVFVVAQQYRVHEFRVSTAVLVSTALSMLTATAAISLLG